MERQGLAPPCECSARMRDRTARKSIGMVFHCQDTEDDTKFDENDPFSGMGGENGEEMGGRGGSAPGREVWRDRIKGGTHGCYLVS